MPKITRFDGNLRAFAVDALGTERTVFGEVIQANDLTSQFTADFFRGWGIVGVADQPSLQDFNAMGYTLGQLIAYLHQMGVAEYNALQEYHLGSFCSSGGFMYQSLINNNVGNTPLTSSTQWTPLRPEGRLIATQVISSPGSSIPTYNALTKSVVITLIGAGGAGGGTAATGSGQGAVSTGGSGGGIAIKRFTSGFSGQTLTVGAGGIPVTAAPGGNGGTTSFGSIFSATGGKGGTGQIASVFPAFAGTNPPGNGLNGDVNGTGNWAENSLIFSATSAFQSVGASGGSTYGGGARVSSDAEPMAGVTGGGGSGVGRSQGLGALPGGVGGNGFAIIEEYS